MPKRRGLRVSKPRKIIHAAVLLAAALLLQGCANGYYACRRQGGGIDLCDEMSRGRV